MRPVSAYRKLILFITLTIVALVASAATSEAQGFRRRSRVVVVGSYYGYPGPYWYADPWYGYGYWGPYGYPPPYRYYGWSEASVRLEVTPRDAEVYVDGYYAGTVDDFDGAFQRLRVEPGQHELEIYKDGFRPLRQKAYLTVDNTFRIRQALQPLAPGEQMEPRPQPVNPPQANAPYGQTQGAPPRGRAGRRMPPPPPSGDPRGTPPPDARGGQTPSAYGSVAIRVQPADAEVFVDGEPWRGAPGQDRLVIELAEGAHTVEIRKPGFRTYVTQVDVRRGETAPLNVSLRQE
jgi:PEGA domain-containing protein